MITAVSWEKLCILPWLFCLLGCHIQLFRLDDILLLHLAVKQLLIFLAIFTDFFIFYFYNYFLNLLLLFF
jgi:hypothetical protein